MQAKRIVGMILLVMMNFLFAACSSTSTPTTPEAETRKVGVLVGPDGDSDKGFNEYTINGARRGAMATGADFFYLVSEANKDFDKYLDEMVADGTDLIITVGFNLGDATVAAARRYPQVRFATVDIDFQPGGGCSEDVQDCYTAEGGLSNITSLMFAEDQLGYLAGVLAACMSKTGTIGSVAGMEIPPVVRFVRGYQHGAKAVNPDVVTLNTYIPDFGDPEAGKVVAEDFISQGADVIFGVGGSTGNGGLEAAHEANLMAIGVDVDQYLSYPEVQDALLTSAVKNVDVVAESAVKDFIAGTLQPGVRRATVASGGVGLAPYHAWDDKIPDQCKDEVQAAKEAISADPTITGAQ